MVAIRAFQGLRPRADLVTKVACPPYDVVSTEEARAYAKGNPLSFLYISRAEINWDTINIYDDQVYAKAAENYRKLHDQKVFVREEHPAIYIYRQVMGGHSQTGIMAAAAVDDYDSDHVKKHEFTRKDKEDDRTRHIDVISANAGPVFLAYRKQEAIDRLVAAQTGGTPTYDFEADGVRHTVWTVTDDGFIAAIVQLFAKVENTYVADGHHRAASASRVRKLRRDRNPKHTGNEHYNRFLAVMFPHDQLRIMPYNRLLLGLNGLTPEQLRERLTKNFDVRPTTTATPTERHHVSMYLEGAWYDLAVKPGLVDERDPVNRLDVQIVQDRILAPLFDIKDPRTDKRIDFVGGIRGTDYLVQQVNAGKAKVAFSLYPTTMDDLFAIADAGKTMPPKSTWFEPKLRSALVLHTLD